MPMRKTILAVSLAIGGLLAAIPAWAHHSFAAEYDSNKPIVLKGVVSKVEWTNPHIWIYVDAKDDAGKVTNWAIEGGAPNSLFRQGWRRDSLKPGDAVTIDGFRAKDGTPTVNARAVSLPDGRKVFAGSADDGGPKAGK